VLTLLEFGEDAGLFDLLLEAAQRDLKVVTVIQQNTGQRNHLPEQKSE
jgi:hypothetical protein